MLKTLFFSLILSTSIYASGGRAEQKGDDFIAHVWQAEDGKYYFQVYGCDFLDSFNHLYEFKNPIHSPFCPCIPKGD